jgi:hypothetical protein
MKMKKMIEKFTIVKLSTKQMRKVKGVAECAHYDDFQPFIQGGGT